MSTCWQYPGSRWWKFDFHTHTPGSQDTQWYTQEPPLTPEEWLTTYMIAEIDCVAVTDHNCGSWVDSLKDAYAGMKAQIAAGSPPPNFRELTIFPGVEISVNGGVHILAVFDPSETTGTIDSLLGQVDYRETKGNSDGVTHKSIYEVIERIRAAGAIPIPAHADGPKGLLRVDTGTRACALSGTTVVQTIESKGLMAVEWINMQKLWPECVDRHRKHFAHVLGSDSHDFYSDKKPGSAYTWVKMAEPTLDGLRLALLDGDTISIKRSDDGQFNPFRTPSRFITAIDVDSARVMGNGQPEKLKFTPFYNAVVGGRGTGKSTVVHALRIVLCRENELGTLGEATEVKRRFETFKRVCQGRDDEGGLRSTSSIRLIYKRDSALYQLSWRVGGEGQVTAVEEWDEPSQCWVSSRSQVITPERFPVRIFSQGQISELVGGGRQALLSIIDESADLSSKIQELKEAKGKYFVLRAQLRQLEVQLSAQPEVERKLHDVSKKLLVFQQGQHEQVLQDYVQAENQRREIERTTKSLQEMPETIESVAQGLSIDAWPADLFRDSDTDAVSWRLAIDKAVCTVQNSLHSIASTLRGEMEALTSDARIMVHLDHLRTALDAFETLKNNLAQQGVMGFSEFEVLTFERRQLELELERLIAMQSEHNELVVTERAQLAQICELRETVTATRADFVQRALHGNEYVRINIEPYGFDAHIIERELRELLDATDDRFASDILVLNAGDPSAGLCFEISRSNSRASTLQSVKTRLVQNDASFGGHFRNYLVRKSENPEFLDRIRVWFPEDDLRIEYKRSGQWHPISHGSQGQRSAALLAFLLAFGDEPVILDQPEDDLDNHLIYDLIVKQIRENKLRRQLIIVTHNANIVVNGDAEYVIVMDFHNGQCRVMHSGALQEEDVRNEVCRVMEGGREAFEHRWHRLGRHI